MFHGGVSPADLGAITDRILFSIASSRSATVSAILDSLLCPMFPSFPDIASVASCISQRSIRVAITSAPSLYLFFTLVDASRMSQIAVSEPIEEVLSSWIKILLQPLPPPHMPVALGFWSEVQATFSGRGLFWLLSLHTEFGERVVGTVTADWDHSEIRPASFFLISSVSDASGHTVAHPCHLEMEEMALLHWSPPLAFLGCPPCL